MAKSFNPRFATPSVIDSIDPTQLCQILRPYRRELAKVGILIDDPNAFNPRDLAALIMSGAGAPDGVVQLVCLLDELAAPRLYDKVLQCAIEAELQLDPEMSSHELAVRLMLANPNAMLEIRTEDFVRQRKRFDRYMAMTDKVPKPKKRTRRRLDELQSALDDEFVKLHRQRDKGAVRVHSTDERNGFRLMIRHGDTRRNQPILDEQDESLTRPLIHRPELYDIVRYDARHGDLLVMAKAKSVVRAYCYLIGHHLFGDRFTFDPALAPRRYTLDPFRDDGAICLERGRIDGVVSLRLELLKMIPFGHDRTPITIGTGDVYGTLSFLGGSIPRLADLRHAVLRIGLRGERDERRVAITPPITATYERDDASEIIEDVIDRIGLLMPRAESLHGAPETLFSHY